MQKNIFIAIFLSAAILCPSQLSVAADNPALPDTKTTREVLDNGMTVLIRENHRAPLASIAAYVKTGSATEDALIGSGISHFVEHMLFKGTRQRPVGQIEQDVKSRGGRMNGFTAYDVTGYSITLPSEHAKFAVDLMSDVLMNASFDPKEMEKEREVILKEIKLNNDNPERRASRLLWSSVFNTHPYRHPVIGYEENFTNLTREDLLRYFKSRYVPNNIVFTVVGDVDTDFTLTNIKEAFKDFKRACLVPQVLPQEEPQRGERNINQRFSTTISHFIVGFHSINVMNEDLFSLDVLSMILGEGKSSRLYERLFRREGTVYAVNSWNYTPKDPGIFGISTLTDEEDIPVVTAAIWEEIEKLKKTPVSEEELTKSKNRVLSEFIASHQTVEEQASDLAFNEVITGNFNFSKRYVEGVSSVEAADLMAAAKKYLTKDNVAMVSLMPQAKEAKKAEGIAAQDEPRPEISKEMLPGGIRLLIREDHTLPMVSARIVFLGGSRMEDESNNGLSNLTAHLLLKGTSTKKAEDIARAIELLGGELETFSGQNGAGLSLECMSKDFKAYFGLLADVLSNPAFQQAEIDKEKRLTLASIKNQSDDIFQRALLRFSKTLFREHPYGLNPLGNEESIRAIMREDILNFYEKYTRPEHMVIAVYGDVNKLDAMEIVKTNLANFVNKKRPNFSMPEIPQEVPPEATRRASETMDREQTILMIGFLGTKVSDNDKYVLEILSSVLSGTNGRLFHNLRDRQGLAYALGAYSTTGLDPGYFLFYVATSPDKVEIAKRELLREIKDITAAPPGDKELELAKQDLIGASRIRFETNSASAFKNSFDELYGLGFKDYLNYEKNIKAVTKGDVSRVAKKYFKLNACVETVVGPELQR